MEFNDMDFSHKSLSIIYLKIVAWTEISYTIFTILGIFTVKIVTAGSVQKEIAKAKTKLVELQFHLKGLGVTWIDFDVELVERIIHGVIWFIFVLGMIRLVLNIFMASQLFRGVQLGDPKRLKNWIVYGFLVFTMNILFYPLQFVICAHSKDVIGPICDPSSTNIWLNIVLSLIFYVSIFVAHAHRKCLMRRHQRQRHLLLPPTDIDMDNLTKKESEMLKEERPDSFHVNELLDLSLDLNKSEEVTSTAN